MKSDTLDKLDDAFRKHPITVAGATPKSTVLELEHQIGFKLPEDYIVFVTRYGGGIVGSYSVYGLRASPAMGTDEASALEVTRRFRKEHWPGTEAWLVISTDLAGNPIGLDKSGRVFISDHDARKIKVLAHSFEEFLLTHCRP